MKTAILLAAGRGERLKPFTDLIPKPLCPIHGKPLIAYHLEHLAKAGYQRVIINHAYLGDQIRHYVGNGQAWGIEALYSPEPPGALETGGGIYQIIKRFQITDPFITVNADIFTNYPFESFQIPQQSLVHLILVPNPDHNPQGDFGLCKDGTLSNDKREYTLAGIIGYKPSVFKDCHAGRYSVTPLLRRLVEDQPITGEVFHGTWQDIGSIARMIAANH